MFIFYKSFLEALSCIPRKSDRWDIVEALCQYSESGSFKILPPRLMPCFLLIKPLIDNGNKKKRGNPNFVVGKQNPYSEEIGRTRRKQFEGNASDEFLKISQSDSVNSSSNKISNLDHSNVILDNQKNNRDNTKINQDYYQDNSKINQDYYSIKQDNSFIDKEFEYDKDIDNERESSKLVINKKIKHNKKIDDFSLGDNFLIPSKNELCDYIKLRKLDVDPDVFFNFYQSKGWFVGSSKMKDWKACIEGWNKKLSNLNLKEKSNMSTRHYSDEELKGLFSSLDDIEI